MSKKSLDGFVEELFNVTYGTYPRKFCFFLGAGASTTSGIPSGQDLVRQWDEYLKMDNPKGHQRWRAQLGITNENMTGFYSDYYDRRYRDFPTDGYADIERITAAGRPSVGYLLLAQMLTQSPHNVVITTNFDHLTEDAVSRFTGRLPLVIGHENLAEFVTGQPSRPTVIKIHRDLLLEPKSASTALQTMDEKWAPALDKILSHYHPVFIGYAGNDKSVMDYLMTNAERFKKDWKKPYWMFYGDAVKSATVREFLEESDGIRMFGCGFDEVMVRMGRALNYELPDLGAIQEREMEAFGEVRRSYEEILAKSILRQATQLRSNSQWSSAVAQYREYLRLKPKDFEAHYCLGICLHESKQYEEAAVECRRAIDLAPGNPGLQNRLGCVYFAMKKYNEAETAFHEAIRLSSAEPLYYKNLALVLSVLNRHEEATALRAQADALEST